MRRRFHVPIVLFAAPFALAAAARSIEPSPPPPPTTAAAAAAATEPAADAVERSKADLSDVQALLEDGDREGAIRRFGRIPPEALADPALAAPAAAVRAKVNVAADGLLDDAAKLLAERKYPEAAKRLEGLLSTMAGLPMASLARQRLGELVSRPEVQAQLQLEDRKERAAAAIAAARRLRDEGKEEEAYAAFQTVAQQFAGTPAGKAAAEAAAAYEHDAAFQRRRLDRAAGPKARTALNLAENYRSAGRADIAKQKYQEIIKHFPGTSYADEARDALAAMNGGG